MDPCNNCVFPRTIPPVTTNSNPFQSSNGFLNVLLPVILVVCALLTIAIGLIFHRLLLKLLRKRWASESVSPGNADGNSSSRRGVNTVSQFLLEPPTYGQVMVTIEKEETPPSYYEISAGVVNYGFAPSETRIEHVCSSHQGEIIDQQILTLHSSSDFLPCPLYTPQTAVNSFVESSDNDSSNDKSIQTSDELHHPKTSNLEEVIDSIAVPSIIYEVETGSTANFPGRKKSVRCGRTSRGHSSKRKVETSRSKNSSLFLRSTQL